MRKYSDRIRVLVFSGTARDTYILFGGNLVSAFLGFVFVLFTARILSVADFGIFSAITNLVTMVSSIADVGISSGLINFMSEAYAKGKAGLADLYLKSAFLVRFVVVLALSLVAFSSAKFISPKLLATSDPMAGVWTGILIMAFFFWSFFPAVMQAKKKFAGSVAIDISFMVARLVALLVFAYFGMNLYKALGAYVFGGIVSGVVGLYLVGVSFLRSRPDKEIYLNLVKFSGWLGVNRVVSSVSGGLDVQMLAAILGATATGFYSISYRLASFIIVLTGSFSSVLATRLAGFGNKDEEKRYIGKATLVTIPIVLGIIFWVVIAEPFITLLFGIKYLPSVAIFQALALSTIPFVLTAPSAAAIIYAIKKPKLIGVFSIVQVVAIFALNFIFIPKFGIFGPALTLGIVNSILAIYTWAIVITHYKS